MTITYSIREDSEEEGSTVTKGGVVLVNPLAAVKVLKKNGTLDLFKSRKMYVFNAVKFKKGKAKKKRVGASLATLLVGPNRKK